MRENSVYQVQSAVLSQIISQYLRSQKRLVVPQMGAFIVKDPDRSVVFSEFLKRDDGVLRGLLRQNGVGDLEAAGEIDRFVFEVRHALQQGAEFPLEGLGVMKPGPNGTIAFVHDPHVVASVYRAQPPQPTDDKASEGKAADHVAAEKPEPVSSGKKKPAPKIMTLYDEPSLFDDEMPQPRMSFRPRRRARSDEYYGKLSRRPAIQPTVVAPRRKDHFLWIALVATAIALAAIAFGQWCESRDRDTLPLRPVSEAESPYSFGGY